MRARPTLAAGDSTNALILYARKFPSKNYAVRTKASISASKMTVDSLTDMAQLLLTYISSASNVIALG